MEDDNESGALIEEDYYTFFNIPRDVRYSSSIAQYKI
jgi:hypothetical protein